MTRRTRQEIDTMSNLMGEVRPGDEKCSDQTQQVSFGRLGHKGDRDRMSVQVRFRLNLSLEAMRIGPVALKRQPHARSNGECRVIRTDLQSGRFRVLAQAWQSSTIRALLMEAFLS